MFGTIKTASVNLQYHFTHIHFTHRERKKEIDCVAGTKRDDYDNDGDDDDKKNEQKKERKKDIGKA